jgi:hypothetical protein
LSPSGYITLVSKVKLSIPAARIERNLAIVESNSTKTLRSDEEKIDAEA